VSDMTGLWKAWWNGHERIKPYTVLGDPLSARRAAQLLNRRQIHTVADWGCGMAGLKPMLRPDQQYIGIDGTKGPCVDIVADLCNFRQAADAVHMRHVLEHNLGWRTILDNAIASARHTLIVTLFTRWATGPTVDRRKSGTIYPVLRINRDEFMAAFDAPPREIVLAGKSYHSQEIMVIRRVEAR
jgi:hypothetical protein